MVSCVTKVLAQAHSPVPLLERMSLEAQLFASVASPEAATSEPKAGLAWLSCLDTINLHTESLDMLTQEYKVCRSKFSLQVCRSKSTDISIVAYVTGDALGFLSKKSKDKK